MDENKKIRQWLVAYDGPNAHGQAAGDVIYNTGPKGMTAEYLKAIKEYLMTPEGGGFHSVRISFFAELSV